MFVCTTLFPPTPTPLHLPHLALFFFMCVCACMRVCVCVYLRVIKGHYSLVFLHGSVAKQQNTLIWEGLVIWLFCCCCCLTCWYIVMNFVCASPSPPALSFLVVCSVSEQCQDLLHFCHGLCWRHRWWQGCWEWWGSTLCPHTQAPAALQCSEQAHQ